MPELPEVETARLSFADRLEGAEVRAVRLGAPLRWPLGVAPHRLVGLCAGATRRRGKYLWLPLLRAGCDDGGLLMHLGMSGSLGWWPGTSAPQPAKHDHFDLVTTHGTLRLTDPRRFGAVLWSRALDAAPAAPLLARLGAEPFDDALTDRAFHAALKRRRAPVKSVLLAGDIVVGAGNIYACEALFEAAIDPRLRADRISAPRAARLLASIRATLARALVLGGTTLRDFRDAHGMDGAFQDEARVYGRAGQPCPRCGAPLRRIVQGQRATYFCAACQRR
ncbi:MAG TPA: bifunctional DNA-formamidopyrimidine glycosylase/DNA-(apurinic or apyrimidinic site) lyase [Burkholderiaceae bacterium]|nr:bifunctional DNA-formamidopyrimidine glycosylase/DNA-(apurinic or apyrimidinic site) lyase [Burkholderiaceae bacterium]